MTYESGLREKIAVALCAAKSPIDGLPILGLDPDFHDRPDHPDGCDEGEVCAVDVLALADAILALISPAGEVVVPVASPLERERFLSILGERLEVAFNAGAEWAQGFDSRREAHSVLDLLSAAPRGMEG